MPATRPSSTCGKRLPSGPMVMRPARATALRESQPELHALSLTDGHDNSELESALTTRAVQAPETDEVMTEPYATVDFEYVTNRDPVLKTIFAMVHDATKFKTRVASYIKLAFYKLDRVREFKASNIPDLGKGLGLDPDVQSAIKQITRLHRAHPSTPKTARAFLDRLITATGRNVPEVYNKFLLDDLCQVYYSIISDSRYPAMEVSPRLKDVSHTFRVHVIARLHLIGGKPASFVVVDSPQTTSLPRFLSDIRYARHAEVRKNPVQLGGDIDESSQYSRWQYATAATLMDLKAKEQVDWINLNSDTFPDMKAVKHENIFVIHSSQAKIPSEIKQKAEAHVKEWNRWSCMDFSRCGDGRELKFAPAEFLPGSAAVMHRDLAIMPQKSKKMSARERDDKFEELERRLVVRSR